MGPRIDLTRIESDRLVLRLPEERDAEAIALQFNDFDVARMTARIPYPYPRPAADMWVLISRVSWPRNCNFVVEHKGEIVGTAGIFRRTPDADWELGYALARHAWGKGYATEIGHILLEFARKTLGANRVIAGHYDDNPASAHVLKKLGFRYTGASCRQFAMARLAKVNCVDMEWTEAV
jgi:RimJ/RimL family protein N-acetyltransferase